MLQVHGVVSRSDTARTQAGGIGPTHDDVTYEAIASAFSTKCVLHQPTLERMHEHYSGRGLEVNDARKRMATLPADSEVLFTEGLNPHWVPLVQHRNVYVLPGIPKLYKAMVTGHRVRALCSAVVHEIAVCARRLAWLVQQFPRVPYRTASLVNNTTTPSCARTSGRAT